MPDTIRSAVLGLTICILNSCQTVQIPPAGRVLTSEQVADLVRRPRRWFGRTVTLQVYPYDFGASSPQSYRICFEPCDERRAHRSMAILDTRTDRFRGYRGDRAALVTARFESNCPVLPAMDGRPMEICPDFVSHRFIAVD